MALWPGSAAIIKFRSGFLLVNALLNHICLWLASYPSISDFNKRSMEQIRIKTLADLDSISQVPQGQISRASCEALGRSMTWEWSNNLTPAVPVVATRPSQRQTYEKLHPKVCRTDGDSPLWDILNLSDLQFAASSRLVAFSSSSSNGAWVKVRKEPLCNSPLELLQLPFFPVLHFQTSLHMIAK